MFIAAEFGTGQVFWSILWFFLFFLWISLVITIFSDIIRSSLSGWGKALWTIGIIALPFLGVFLYLIVNGDDMTRRNVQQARDLDEATRSYVQSTVGGGSAAGDQLGQLADLHGSGALTDDEYEQAKANVITG